MIYKGQKLSDNLTQSQRDMFKYMIDRGDSVDDKVNEILREPDKEEPDVEEKIKLAEKVGEVIKVLDALDK